jgi:putative membrane protein insertion efficiency factor
MDHIWKSIWHFPGWMLIICVRVYQLTLSRFLGQNCRFHPTCSAYFILAVKKYGAIRGSIKGIYRIFRCHPWNPGGEDFP